MATKSIKKSGAENQAPAKKNGNPAVPKKVSEADLKQVHRRVRRAAEIDQMLGQHFRTMLDLVSQHAKAVGEVQREAESAMIKAGVPETLIPHLAFNIETGAIESPEKRREAAKEKSSTDEQS